MTPQIKPRSRRRTRAKSIPETTPSTQQPDNSDSEMVTFYDEIVPELHDFITAQTVFFTGTAPLHLPNSHVNVSPKGYADSTFTIANSKCVWYQDATGSGVETIAHLYDNERITIMFCSFGPQPLIVRLFGKGKVYEVRHYGGDVADIEFGSKEFDELVPEDKRLASARAVIRIDIHKTSGSCGYGVPLMQFVEERETLNKWGDFLTKVTCPLKAFLI